QIRRPDHLPVVSAGHRLPDGPHHRLLSTRRTGQIPGTHLMHAFLKGLAASISIAAGYIPIAFSFGLASLEAGLSPLATILISVLVFAGASQFVMISLLASGAGVLVAVPTILLMNARHLFYGPALATKLQRD